MKTVKYSHQCVYGITSKKYPASAPTLVEEWKKKKQRWGGKVQTLDLQRTWLSYQHSPLLEWNRDIIKWRGRTGETNQCDWLGKSVTPNSFSVNTLIRKESLGWKACKNLLGVRMRLRVKFEVDCMQKCVHDAQTCMQTHTLPFLLRWRQWTTTINVSTI